MPSLSDLVKQQTSQFAKSNTSAGGNFVKGIEQQGRNAVNSAIQSVKQMPGQIINGAKAQVEQAIVGGVRNAINNVVNAGRGAVQGVISAGTRGVTGAIGQALEGNFSAAGQSLLKIGDDVITAGGKAIDNIQSVFGMSSGSRLSGPSAPSDITQASSAMSGNGGVTPGDALNGALARTDPLMTYCWYAEVPVITSQVGTASLPWYFIEEATIPFREFSTRSIFRDGRNKHYASTYSVSNLNLRFYADTALQSLQYLYAWNSAIMTDFAPENAITQGGRFNVPNTYKRPINIHILSVTRQELVTITYTECWPINVSELNLGSTGSERIVYNVNFSVGDVFVRLYDLSNKTSNDVALSDIGGMSRTESSGISGPSTIDAEVPGNSPDVQSMPIPTDSSVTSRPLDGSASSGPRLNGPLPPATGGVVLEPPSGGTVLGPAGGGTVLGPAAGGTVLGQTQGGVIPDAAGGIVL